MELFTWNDKYSVNNEELDKHHKILFDILDRMYYSCFDMHNRYALYSVIDEFISYTQYHFPVEEQKMINIGYIDIDKHVSEHKTFIENILNIRYKNNDDKVVIKALIVNIGNKIINHVMMEDKKYSI